jgi:hypothetical protein
VSYLRRGYRHPITLYRLRLILYGLLWLRESRLVDVHGEIHTSVLLLVIRLYETLIL